MGFYSPATIVKDAQRHGLKLLPVDVTKSEWNCMLETVRSTQYSVPSTQYSEFSGGVARSLVGEDRDKAAAKRRQNAAHGASRGSEAQTEPAPEGRKNFNDGQT